ncbi:hypothetical protein [Paractinoplanes rishiriensis]|uniref:hypothetical protein n=1 Tax=Paractinoplanes rishiriensis TaxID=1050105 RepID=UPI001EF32378|nr:hypothetical protein [Actinoplanes rishiriensis]
MFVMTGMPGPMPGVRIVAAGRYPMVLMSVRRNSGRGRSVRVHRRFGHLDRGAAYRR